MRYVQLLPSTKYQNPEKINIIQKIIGQHLNSYHITLLKVPQHSLKGTTSHYSKYHITLFKVTHNLFKVPHHPFQSTTQPLQRTTSPFSKYHTTSSKYHITLFEVSHHHLQSTTSHSTKYHITLFTTSPSSKYLVLKLCRVTIVHRNCRAIYMKLANDWSLTHGLKI